MPLPINNDQYSLALTQFFPMSGIYPSPDVDSGGIPLGSIRTFAGNFAFGGSFTAEGQVLAINQNTAVFSLLGTTYGGNGTTNYALPDLDGRTMIGVGQGPGLGAVQLGVPVGSSQVTLATEQLPFNVGGSSQPFDNYQDSLPIHYLIRTEGVFPSEGGGTGGNDFMGEIVPFAGTFVPGGFMEAAGQTLQIADYETLFQLIGTTYGGDGDTTFQLPDLRGRTIVGASSQSQLGAMEGQALSFVSNANLPVSAGGGGQPIDNHEPSLALTYLISRRAFFYRTAAAGSIRRNSISARSWPSPEVSPRRAGRWHRASFCRSVKTRLCSPCSARNTAAMDRPLLLFRTCATGRRSGPETRQQPSAKCWAATA
jgi:microcystin-dependent protein